jgi:erythromycin esterase
MNIKGYLVIIFVLLLSSCKCAGNDSRAYKTKTSQLAKNSDIHSLTSLQLVELKSVSFESDTDVEQFFLDIPDRRIILLGESTHGTSQYYKFRDALTRKLIEERNISFIAVEGDWPTIFKLNKYVKGLDSKSQSAKDILKTFSRWPQWMWANQEVAQLAEWLKSYNASKPEKEKVGFYGMDVYGQWDAMDAMLEKVEIYFPLLYERVLKKANCFATDDRDVWRYAHEAVANGISCVTELEKIVSLIKDAGADTKKVEPYVLFNILQNAKVFKNAEAFYRLAVQGDSASWNSRVLHMAGTVKRLLKLYGPESKAVIWAHNTHVGDSRETVMKDRGQINIGKLAREEYGRDNVFIIGFSSYKGTVLAGTGWGAPMQKMPMPPGISGSVEDLFKQAGGKNRYMIFDDEIRAHRQFAKPMGHRAVGVVYNPSQERGNYVETILPQRYDAIVFFENTDELVPVR